MMIENWNFAAGGNLLRDLIVLFIRLVFSTPAVEDPIIKSKWILFCRSSHEGRPIVSHPNIHGGQQQQRHALHGSTAASEPRRDIESGFFIVDEQINLLMLRQRLNHLQPYTSND